MELVHSLFIPYPHEYCPDREIITKIWSKILKSECTLVVNSYRCSKRNKLLNLLHSVDIKDEIDIVIRSKSLNVLISDKFIGLKASKYHFPWLVDFYAFWTEKSGHFLFWKLILSKYD